jgi:hypothetical protein
MAQSGAQDFGSIVSGLTGIFGSDTTTTGNSQSSAERSVIATRKGENTEQLELDDAAVQQIIRDVLGGADGLAAIFAGEKNAGLFNASASNQAAGDLASKLVGELAKITGKNVSTTDQTEETEQTEESRTKSRSKSDDGGLLSGLGL